MMGPRSACSEQPMTAGRCNSERFTADARVKVCQPHGRSSVSGRHAPSARAQRRPWSFRHLRSWIAARRSFLSTTPARARAWRGQAARSGAKRREQRPGEAGGQYLVDGQDRRVGKKKNGVLERAWLFRNQLNPVAELDGSGALVARFVYGAKSNVPEYVVRGGVTYRVLSDHLGSPRALVDVVTGAVAWRADFDAWGNRTLIAGTADFLPFGFAGGMLDSETGLTRFGARDYDPAVGRWMAKDPIRFDAGDSDLYAYAFADPANRADPSGAGYVGFMQCLASGASFGTCFLREYFAALSCLTFGNCGWPSPSGPSAGDPPGGGGGGAPPGWCEGPPANDNNQCPNIGSYYKMFPGGPKQVAEIVFFDAKTPCPQSIKNPW